MVAPDRRLYARHARRETITRRASRHCEERSDEAIESCLATGLLRFARNDDYAARTVARNLMTSAFSRLFSFDSSCAEDSTCDEAEPLSPAPRCTSAMQVATCVLPIAACWTLRAIS